MGRRGPPGEERFSPTPLMDLLLAVFTQLCTGGTQWRPTWANVAEGRHFKEVGEGVGGGGGGGEGVTQR